MKSLASCCLFVFLATHFLFSQNFVGGSGVILDLETVEVPISVNGIAPTIDTASFGVEQVCITVSHTYVSDLEISLVAPDGTVISLVAGVGGGDDNFENTCFRADVASTITAGVAPFSGVFKPMGQLGLVNNGQNPNGIWKLRVYDRFAQDQGAVESWSITFGNSPATYFQFTESDLPIVVIQTNGQTIVDDPKILADLGIIFNGNGVRNHISDPKNAYDGKVGIEIRGNYSASLPQKPYAIELQDVNGNAISAPILGMPSENDWCLIANYNDKSFARNFLPYELFDAMGHYSVRSRLVDVVINGEYKGIYLLTEKIKKDANRVDISTLNPTEIAGQDLTGGYILKIDYWDNANSWLLNYHPIGFPTVDVHMVYYYPKPADLVPQQKTYIQGFINDFETALYSANFADTANGYRKYIDVPSFIDYFIINELARNVDGFKKSRFFSKDKDHADGRIRKMKAGPVWDFDWAFKDMWSGSEDGSQFMYGDVDQDVDAPGWYIRLLQDPQFKDELRCRYDDLRRSILSEEYLFAQIDSIANLVLESQAWHFETWGNLGLPTGTGEVQSPAQSYPEEVQRLKDWLSRRLAWLDDNMPGTLNGCSFAGLNNDDQHLGATVFPNPFSNEIEIRFQGPIHESFRYKLMDQTGRIIQQQTVSVTSPSGTTIHLKELENLVCGIYFIELIHDGQQVLYKLVKK